MQLARMVKLWFTGYEYAKQIACIPKPPSDGDTIGRLLRDIEQRATEYQVRSLPVLRATVGDNARRCRLTCRRNSGSPLLGIRI